MPRIERSAAPVASAATPASLRSRELPTPGPKTIKVGSLVAKRVAQTDDMLRYVVHIKGRPVYVDLMEKHSPRSALGVPDGFLRGRTGVLVTDRDGVLNKASTFLNKASDVTDAAMLPEALQGAKALADAGVGLVIATNQGGYQSGKMSLEDAISVNVMVAQKLADAGGRVDAIIICPFVEAATQLGPDELDARKPAAGMTRHAATMAQVVRLPVLGMVGDQRTDGAAGQGANLKFYAVTDERFGRWKAEKDAAAARGETLPALDSASGRYAEVSSFKASVDEVLRGVRPGASGWVGGPASGTGAAEGGGSVPR